MTKDSVAIIIVVALIGPLLTYVVAARRLSGKIKNSEASDLWAESRSIREWSTGENKRLSDELEAVEIRLTEIEQKNGELLAENKGLMQELAAVQRLLDAERNFNDRLRWEAEHSPKRRRTDEHLINGEGDNLDPTRNEG